MEKTGTREGFKVAVRAFGPFESSIRKQWEAFEGHAHCGLRLVLHSFDLHRLYDALFGDDRLLDDYDVVFINTDWVLAAHRTQRVLDLAPFIASDPPEGYPQGWTASLRRLQTIKSAVVGLPYHDGPECLIYRRDLFLDQREQQAYAARFGTPLRIPTTWDDFRQVSRFFHRPEAGLWGSAFAGYPDCHNTVYDFVLQLWTRNGSLLNEAGKLQFYTAQANAALDYYRSLMQDPSAAHPGSRDFDSVQLGEAFAKGEVAMMVNWFGFAAWAETCAKSSVRGKIDLAPVPHGAGCSSASLNVYWLLSIASGCPRPALAYAFLRHCMSPAMDKLLTLEGAVGCRISTWNDAEVRSAVPHFRHLETLHAYARELPAIAEWRSIAEVIDGFVRAAAITQEPIDRLLTDADVKALGADEVAKCRIATD
jgi:multiple sugar transport system substrate-binding protein